VVVVVVVVVVGGGGGVLQAATAASVLRQAQLYEEAVMRRKQTEALRQITELMAADIGTEMVVPRLIDAAYKLVHAERISFFTIIDKRSGEALGRANAPASALLPGGGGAGAGELLHRRATALNTSKAHPTPSSGELGADPSKTKELVCTVSKDPAMIGMRIAWGDGIVGHVGLTLKSLNIGDVRRDARWNPTADRTSRFITRSILTVPVIDSDHRGVAVIQAINKQGADPKFSPEDVSILETLGACTALFVVCISMMMLKCVACDRVVARGVRWVACAQRSAPA
jgi:GAF domain-containing protein